MIPVKYFNSGMQGAPVLSNNWGSLIDVLDACLVTGFNLKTIDSLTSSNGIATATINAGHGYMPGNILLIAGADQPEYNGEVRVINTTTTTFTYAITGTPASPATTSTNITVKVAPLGWEKAFSGTNKAAYRSQNVASPRYYLRVDDSLKTPGYNTSWAKWANVGIVETMTDIDTPSGAQAPFDPSSPMKNWQQVQSNQWGWYKWYHARTYPYENSGDGGSSARDWILIGDDRLFYFFCNSFGSYYGRTNYCFGDILSFKPADQYATILVAEDVYLGNSTSISYPGQGCDYGLVRSLNFTGKLLLRSYTQLGNPVRFGVTSLNINNDQQTCGGGDYALPFPNGPDYSLWLLPAYIKEESGHMRGLMPGMYWIPHNHPYSDQTIVDNVIGQTGKKFIIISTQYIANKEGAQIAFDIIGPWR